MDGTPNIAKIGSLIGDNTRACILTTLMHGKALTASELAAVASVTAQTATSHLAKLEAGGLLKLRKQGRHKYFALASEEVASMLESLMGFTAAAEPLHLQTGPRNAAMHYARVCYNHLAGHKSTQLYDNLIANRYLVEHDGEPALTDTGANFMTDFGINVRELQAAKSPLCRSCLDWSERRTHLSGSLGRALFSEFERRRWMKQVNNGRTVTINASGEKAFNKLFPESA